MTPPLTILGTDVGGTFTDFALAHNGKLILHKRLTTVPDPADGLITGLQELGDYPLADVVHGSTIATNALLERRGAITALITTQGFKDVLEIGRQNRPELYALVPTKPPPLIPAERRIEVNERVIADGSTLTPLDPSCLPTLMEQLKNLHVESVAVALLFSFLNPAHEKLLGSALEKEFPVTLSSELLPEYREYERTSTTAINAYVMPLMDRYLRKVEEALGERRLRVMQSNGGSITASTARKQAARTVLSGPAGGAVGAFHVGAQAGFDQIIGFDMGGTSTDVSIFPGRIIYTREAQIGGMPIRLPMIDIHTIGAGGGSIARVDAGGALRVGPHSAGADPGPACYGKGELPTTTDANLVLGRLHPDHFLGGKMRLEPERSMQVMDKLAAQLGLASSRQAALGVIRVANAAMQRAIRVVSIGRGYDVREFTLLAFGGAGPLHACDLAAELEIPRILIPRLPGVLSALGMILCDLVRDYSRTILLPQNMLDHRSLGTIFSSLEAQARSDFDADRVHVPITRFERVLEMRYGGQSHEIEVSEPEDGNWVAAFAQTYLRRYGYQHEPHKAGEAAEVEAVNARLRVIAETPGPSLEKIPDGGPDPASAKIGEAQVWFDSQRPLVSSLYERDALLAGNHIAGPAVVFQLDSTVCIPPDWLAVTDTWGNLIITR